jgi:hypothetical protein
MDIFIYLFNLFSYCSKIFFELLKKHFTKMIPGVTRGALKTMVMAGAGLFLITEILKELNFSNSLNGEIQD